jgi:tripartite-type tricarboxylate transporter receptor subunit TctC
MKLFSLMGRRQAARTAVVLCAALTGYAAMAQNFPARSIRLVVAQAPGSSADALARSVATKMAESFKSAVVVDNKPGANGNLGMDLVAKAAPDGYTLGLAVPSVMTVNPYVYKNMPFKPLEDLVGVTQTTSIIFGLHINPKLPVKSVADLVAYAKRQPNGLNYSSAGVGNLGHLAGELFAAQAGIKMTHIPNKGDTPGLLDVMGGQTDLMFAPVPSAISYVRGGRLTLLAVASRKRSAAFPEVPTLIEAGLPQVVVEGWTGIVAPAATPAAVIAELQRAVNASLADPGIRASVEQQGFEIVGSNSRDFTQFMKQESAKWGELIQRSGIKLAD